MQSLAEQITNAYRQDQERGFRPVTRAGELPNSFEEVTDQWLTETLASTLPAPALPSTRGGPWTTAPQTGGA